MMNTKELKKDNNLLSKKDFLTMVENDPNLNIDEFKKMKIKDLREFFKLTHKIDGQYKNYYGYCFKCLTPLRADYKHHENYCLDC